ncbi:MAG TPA: nitroreductase [Armatimonadetes bacterium]|nr:nitroreductase [Armatimonadota bacterium]
MDLFDAIHERYSYRGALLPTPVPRADLERIAAAGLAAPSGCNAQTPRLILVDHPALLAEAAQILGGREVLATAPALIAVLIDAAPEPTYEGFAFQIEDCAAAVENMLLAVTALGYASVWLDGNLRVQNRAEALGALLGVPADKRVRVILPVGRPAGTGARREKLPYTDRYWFNRYEARD